MRRYAFILLAASLAAAACGGGTATTNPGGGGGTQTPVAPTGGGGGGGGDWSGNGSAQVTIGGTTVTLSLGGCLDGGSRGVDFRFGAWDKQTADWIIGLAHHDGSNATVTGSVGGKPFVLGTDVAATIGADGKGTFSGTDSVGGNGKITATFSCS